MIILIDNYDSFTYNLVHYLGELGPEVKVYRNDKITVADVLAQKPQAIVISPGPCDPDQAGISLELVKQAGPNIPILGVCLGHQTIGQAYGGRIVRAPELMHGKVSLVHHQGLGIFAEVPTPFEATRYHSLVIDPDSLPEVLDVTAHTEDGIIMAVAHKTHPVFGVQFHPESIASEHGHQLLANFLKIAGINVKPPRPLTPIKIGTLAKAATS